MTVQELQAGDAKKEDPKEAAAGAPGEAEEEPERGRFANRTESVLYAIGMAVGIGDVWRFPILAYQNGGGAFFAAYLLIIVVMGVPLFIMEISFGQFATAGPIVVWNCLPVARGIGVGMVILSVLVAIYYNVVLAYSLYYLAQSFRSELPWAGCFEWWGADRETCYLREAGLVHCWEVPDILSANVTETPASGDAIWLATASRTNFSVPKDLYFAAMANCTNATQTASEQFWEKYVLHLSANIDEVGSIRWGLCLCLFISWFLVCICLIRGVTSSGKVVYFTATFPYVVLTILLIKGVTLSGSFDGIKYFLLPDFQKLANINVWRKAAEQAFYSLNLSWGVIIMVGSYNHFRNKDIFVDTVIVFVADVLTSLFGGIAIFSVLGHMSMELGIPIESVAKAGQGLAFVVYPEALASFWFPQLWSVIFFFMLFILGIDSEFPLLQTALTVLSDTFPWLENHRATLSIVSCTLCFLIGITNVTDGGQYVLNLMDTYSAGLSLIFIGFCEVTAVMWIYGVNNFSEDMTFMIGSSPSLLMRICWAYVIPGVLFVLTFHGFFHAIPITYNNTDPYPEWANIFGWCIAALSMVQIPLWAIVALYNRRNNLKSAFLPTEDWGPRDPQDFREYRALRWPLEKPPPQSPPAPSPTKVLNVPHDAPATPHNAPAAPHNAPATPHNAPDAPHNAPDAPHNKP